MRKQTSLSVSARSTMLALAAVAAMSGPALAAPLGTLSGLSKVNRVGGVAAGGKVVGQGQVGDAPGGPSRAFLSEGPTITDLGTLGGTSSSAGAVNDSGEVVGESTLDDESIRHAFLYSGGGMTDLGTLGGVYSSATGINKSGRVVGLSYTVDGKLRAFSYENGKMTDLGTLGGPTSSAGGINDAGQVVGQSSLSDGDRTHAFRHSGGTMTDLGTLGGTKSFGNGINASGDVVGQAYTANDASARAFLYREEKMIDIGTLAGFEASTAKGINDAGQVVGNAYGKADPVGGASVQHAFLYDRGLMKDLNDVIPKTSGWVLTDATGIGNDGTVAGFGLLDGQRSAFRLDLNALATVPEPTTLAAFALVLAGVGARALARRRRSR